ncbi:LPXTG cell wall anchor domain-containing protein [Streptomyces sp. NBC_00237]|uniref:LPXTG cell wall anchor domain-containing protein n=1 Tax=Streptomyces sp. NBC_00237 TaxID=2975687 RepID=UPI00225248AF|nr:LPXTG cell wall anchor domain-containing protein [Streptomyces sp. NBC_00237]MCX5201437.1 LPXTG cell wall anchor domain-containing protein [Streptomyces sp. NBC_00237]
MEIVPPVVVDPPVPPGPDPEPEPCSKKPGSKNPCKPVKPVKPCSHKPGATHPCKRNGHQPQGGSLGQLAETGGDTDSLLAIGGVSGLLLLGGGLTLAASRRRNH